MTVESNHQSMVIKAAREPMQIRGAGGICFRFDEMWTRHANYDAMINDAWAGSDMGSRRLQLLCDRHANVSRRMQDRGCIDFGSIQLGIKRLRALLTDTQDRALVTGSMQEFRSIENYLHDIYRREGVMYRQRPRLYWLKASDRNT